MAKIIRVLLADDHPVVLQGISHILSNEEDLLLVGEAVDGYEVQRLCQEYQPDVLLLDLSMPGPSSFDTVAYLRRHCPETKVLILTAYDEDAYVRGLTATGIAGYMLKDEAVEKVVRAIRAVARGDTWFSRPVVVKLAQASLREINMTRLHVLSDRERQILTLLAQGWNNKCIADELNLAEQTVRNGVSRIYAKLEIETRSEAIVLARECGLVLDKPKDKDYPDHRGNLEGSFLLTSHELFLEKHKKQLNNTLNTRP